MIELKFSLLVLGLICIGIFIGWASFMYYIARCYLDWLNGK